MKKRWIAVALIVSILGTGSLYTYHSYATTNYDKEIKSAEEKKRQLDTKKKNLQNEIEELEGDKTDVLKYIKKLDKKTKAINESLDSLTIEVGDLEQQLVKAQEELTIAKDEEQKQYDTMKSRIKYMYEHGNSDYMDIVFSADNISDFLNRTEYIEKISEYDNSMFSKFQNTRQEIEKKEQSISESLTEVTDLKAQVKAEKDAIETLSDNKAKELKKYESALTSSREKKREYEKEAAKQEAEVERLLDLKRKEIEAQIKAQKAQQSAGNQNDATDQYVNATGDYRWPLGISGRLSSTFGYRQSPTAGASSYHKGIDIAAATGTPILASNSGTVVTATYSSSAGNYIMIYHGNSIYTVYMHCSSLSVAVGTNVTKGQVIGAVGSTGISTGAHLHFGISVNGNYVNPLHYVKQ